jgi:glutamyl-tRNA reductase
MALVLVGTSHHRAPVELRELVAIAAAERDRTLGTLAVGADTAGPVLHRLFGHALKVGKRVRTETAIAENPASVSSAATELAERVVGDLAGRRVLVLGAGKMGELTAACLISRGAASVVMSRTDERADRLAERLGGRAAPLGELDGELTLADVVVASTTSAGYALTADQVARAMSARRGRPLFFVDIAVPRDVDPDVNRLEGCYLYDIDDLERVVADSVAGRREEAIRAETIVAEEGEAFRAWQLSLDVVPAIASLRELGERIRTSELARAEHRLDGLSPSQRRAVESLTSQIVAKLLHAPTVRLKEAAVAAEGPGYADAVRHLFRLGEDER